MKCLRNVTLALAAVFAAYTTNASAQYQHGFGNISVNYGYLIDDDSSGGGINLKLEGGADFSWGDLYGFIEMARPQSREMTNNNDIYSFANMKGTIRINLGDSGFNLYGHIRNMKSDNYYMQDSVAGFGYHFTRDSFFFKPFIGLEDTQSSHNFLSNSDSYILGWVLGYDFKAFGEDMLVTHRYETTFGHDYRKKTFQNQKARHDQTLGLWWNASDAYSLGLHYKSTKNWLGTDSDNRIVTYSLKYNF